MSVKKPIEEGSTSNSLKCPPNKIIFDHEKGEYVCLETGEVIEERIIDERAEWRAFTPEEREKRARTGGPITSTVHDMGFATSIDYSDKDASGRKIIEKKAQLQKLRRWQARTRIQTSIDRNLAQALNELDRISELLNLPTHVREEAARIYRMAVEKGLVRGRSIESVIAAAVYVASRAHRIPRSLDEITKYTRIPRKEIARCYRLLLKELGIRVTAVDPIDFIPRIAHALGLSGEIVKNATEILNKVRNKGITAGKDPAGLAAAAVYIAALQAGEKRTQKEVAHVAGVTEVTVRNRYKEIIEALGLEDRLEE
ncbi:transcription initiation factor IIB [Thermogladius sp. 4427co]|uniref:transcription initiation factor IIB n=1 Tax=Thermogladius sp. 4427co TaxID=3450718 RepID=UPI003F79942E